MPHIAISYRRSDSSAITGRIFDRLAAHYGADAVFMDIDNIPFGIDFRSHIRQVWLRTDVLIAVIGVNWIGAGDAGPRIREETDPVRVEIETALEHRKPIIPVLVDGARMPPAGDLPAGLGNFAFLNAAEVASGRDFHAHVDRLIAAIDGAVGSPPSVRPGRAPAAPAGGAASISAPWRGDLLRYLACPLVVLIAAHHLIVNAYDLNTAYLWLAATVVPLGFGFAMFSVGGRGAGAAIGFALALGVVADAAMTVSQSLSSGDPILPQNRIEWRDNIQLAGAIALAFVLGHVLARALAIVLRLRRKP